MKRDYCSAYRWIPLAGAGSESKACPLVALIEGETGSKAAKRLISISLEVTGLLPRFLARDYPPKPSTCTDNHERRGCLDIGWVVDLELNLVVL
jgi:hypothetical protein